MINMEDIRAKAKSIEDLDERFKTDTFTIVSCGRLDPVKQFSKIPEIALEIKAKSDKVFRWYIIGGGFPEEQRKIEMEIEKYGLENTVFLLGQKNNVYPYMAKANIYVCTSQSESFPLVVNEAKALCVPVISNNFPSVYEPIEEGVDGFVVPLEKMSDKIIDFMDNPLVINHCRIDNTEALESFYKVFEA